MWNFGQVPESLVCWWLNIRRFDGPKSDFGGSNSKPSVLMSRVEVVTSSFCCQNPICVKLCRSNPRFAMSSAENGSSPSVSPQTKQQNPTVCPKQVANQHLSPKIPQTKSVDIYKNPPKTHHFPKSSTPGASGSGGAAGCGGPHAHGAGGEGAGAGEADGHRG